MVPSQTELLFDLGLGQEVVGITKFCVHPEKWFHNKARIGGTKTLKIEIIDSLQPDLIIANKEENTREQVEELAKRYPVWISDVNDMEMALKMIVSIGELTNKQAKAIELRNSINKAFAGLPPPRCKDTQLRTSYLIWRDPYMAVGRETFINAMLRACGLRNIFEHLTRYPEIKIEDLQTINTSDNIHCQLLLLSSEPYPFADKHIHELQRQLPGTKVMLVDGEMFSWYGSRLVHAAEYFKKLLAEVKDHSSSEKPA